MNNVNIILALGCLHREVSTTSKALLPITGEVPSDISQQIIDFSKLKK